MSTIQNAPLESPPFEFGEMQGYLPKQCDIGDLTMDSLGSWYHNNFEFSGHLFSTEEVVFQLRFNNGATDEFIADLINRGFLK